MATDVADVVPVVPDFSSDSDMYTQDGHNLPPARTTPVVRNATPRVPPAATTPTATPAPPPSTQVVTPDPAAQPKSGILKRFGFHNEGLFTSARDNKMIVAIIVIIIVVILILTYFYVKNKPQAKTFVGGLLKNGVTGSGGKQLPPTTQTSTPVTSTQTPTTSSTSAPSTAASAANTSRCADAGVCKPTDAPSNAVPNREQARKELEEVKKRLREQEMMKEREALIAAKRRAEFEARHANSRANNPDDSSGNSSRAAENKQNDHNANNTEENISENAQYDSANDATLDNFITDNMITSEINAAMRAADIPPNFIPMTGGGFATVVIASTELNSNDVPMAMFEHLGVAPTIANNITSNMTFSPWDSVGEHPNVEVIEEHASVEKSRQQTESSVEHNTSASGNLSIKRGGSDRCTAMTANGKQCARNAQSGGRCRTHANQ